MPHPREAIHDVLKSQQERAAMEKARAKEVEIWAEYERKNAQANEAYRPR